MKVLISGGAGYIGSSVASYCLDSGITPVVLDNLVTGRREFTTGRIFYEGDIADGELVDRIYADHPDIHAVIHCAALIVVPDSVNDPVGYYRSNVTKTLEFLSHLLHNGCERLIFSSSASVYRAGDDFTVDEESTVDPKSPYARSKAICEDIMRDISTVTPLRTLSLRYFNPLGADPQLRTGTQLPRTRQVVGKLIQAYETGSPFRIAGDGFPTRDGSGIRDYLHVWDLAAAHVAALRHYDRAMPSGARSTVINLGTGTGTTVFELLAAFNQVADTPITSVVAPPRPGDAPGAFTRTDRAARLLGWRAERTLTDGLRDALAWAAVWDERLPEPDPARLRSSTP
ncbi:UDP-glucose 4-epimerase GalE [Streptomyces lunaelactis]|uniref:UDP-glucose 4-epimerase GalE n=1 Tax=Streptomyces lunaelactis TaxID=1535768 RepID=UPI0015847D85|nr:UDP-glucose 4-epimerase GalE [Streptomyces lunaelactis]NUK71089.1 UDP-glucose 4-epimerase GalE [Streptomyces lunaelactis]NUK79699.1 UDP-glucose 4-epimerase GalE [Streptomyces lunaelactis]